MRPMRFYFSNAHKSSWSESWIRINLENAYCSTVFTVSLTFQSRQNQKYLLRNCLPFAENLRLKYRFFNHFLYSKYRLHYQKLLSIYRFSIFFFQSLIFPYSFRPRGKQCLVSNRKIIFLCKAGWIWDKIIFFHLRANKPLRKRKDYGKKGY